MARVEVDNNQTRGAMFYPTAGFPLPAGKDPDNRHANRIDNPDRCNMGSILATLCRVI